MRRFLLVALVLMAGCSKDEPQDTPDSGTSVEDQGTARDQGGSNDSGRRDDTGGPLPTDMGDGSDGGDDAGAGEDMQLADMGPVARPIGPRPVMPTAANLGTLFAAPDGSGEDCSMANPCDIWEASDQAEAGDVVFMRGGVYDIDRNFNFRGRGANPPAIFESFPGEVAILDGSSNSAGDEVYIRVLGDPVVLRLFEVRNFPQSGISVRTSDNILEGLTVYDNLLSGIHVHEDYDVPSSNNNLITDCVIYGNSGAGLGGASYADGGNSDGISMSSGIGNRIENCLVYANSDDGIDTWRTLDSYVGYTITHSNGIASGNGNGFKSGGAPPSSGTTVEHCVSYSNTAVGFDQNSGLNVTFRYNTSWDNGRGYWHGDDTTSEYNVAYESTNPTNTAGTHTDNSWQRNGDAAPLSTDPNSADFLVPNAGFDDIGAHANREQN